MWLGRTAGCWLEHNVEGRLEMILERQVVQGFACHDKELGFTLNVSARKKLM